MYALTPMLTCEPTGAQQWLSSRSNSKPCSRTAAMQWNTQQSSSSDKLTIWWLVPNRKWELIKNAGLVCITCQFERWFKLINSSKYWQFNCRSFTPRPQLQNDEITLLSRGIQVGKTFIFLISLLMFRRQWHGIVKISFSAPDHCYICFRQLPATIQCVGSNMMLNAMRLLLFNRIASENHTHDRLPHQGGRQNTIKMHNQCQDFQMCQTFVEVNNSIDLLFWHQIVLRLTCISIIIKY